MATTTGGKYFFAGDGQQLEGICAELDQLETREVEGISHRPRVDLYHWPLGGALAVGLVCNLMVVFAGTRRLKEGGRRDLPIRAQGS